MVDKKKNFCYTEIEQLKRREQRMRRMTKITQIANYQRYFTSFCHAIVFCFSVYGISVIKNNKKTEKNDQSFVLL